MSERDLGSFMIAANHPCLPGHFPGRPLVPGVVLLDEVFALIEADPETAGWVVGSLANAKFLSPVGSDQQIVVRVREIASNRLGFACRVAKDDVLTGVLMLGEPT
ncbi:MAG: hypothetical protein ACRYGI_10710 [Janthinobacterium lividum]